MNNTPPTPLKRVSIYKFTVKIIFQTFKDYNLLSILLSNLLIMNINYLELAKIALPLLAIAISIITIIMTRKNLKKQLRLSKLEEIYEIIDYFLGYYTYLFWLVNDVEAAEEKKKTGKKLEEYEIELPKKIEEFINLTGKETVSNKLSRLYVLTNAYLPNNKIGNLKIKILVFGNLINTMFFTISTKDMSKKNRSYKEGIPKPKKMIEFLESIERELIKEMQLGFDSASTESFLKYQKRQFKIDLGIISSDGN